MKLTRKKEREKRKNSDKCFSYIYPINDEDLDISFIEIKGRYPDKGFVMNEKVKELIFVQKGKGKIFNQDKFYNLEEGDEVLILSKEKYFFEGKLKLIAACSPAWYQEQHKSIED